MRPLVVGQAPVEGHEQDPAFVGTRSGDRLARLCGLAHAEELPDHFDLVNVLPWRATSFNPTSAVVRAAGAALRGRTISEGRSVVVCCGSGVARAMGLVGSGGGRLFEWESYGCFEWAIAPHPSGRNRFWNDPPLVAQASAWWTELLATVDR